MVAMVVSPFLAPCSPLGEEEGRLPGAVSMPLCVSLGPDSDCPALLGSHGGSGSVFLPMLWCVCFSPPPHISGLKALVLSQVIWLHFFLVSLRGSGLYGFFCVHVSLSSCCVYRS